MCTVCTVFKLCFHLSLNPKNVKRCFWTLLQCTQSELDIDSVRSILSEYRIANADITLRYDANADDLIDVIEGNRYRKTELKNLYRYTWLLFSIVN